MANARFPRQKTIQHSIEIQNCNAVLQYSIICDSTVQNLAFDRDEELFFFFSALSVNSKVPSGVGLQRNTHTARS